MMFIFFFIYMKKIIWGFLFLLFTENPLAVSIGHWSIIERYFLCTETGLGKDQITCINNEVWCLQCLPNDRFALSESLCFPVLSGKSFKLDQTRWAQSSWSNLISLKYCWIIMLFSKHDYLLFSCEYFIH